MEKLTDQIRAAFDESARVKQDFVNQQISEIAEAASLLISCFRAGHKVLIFGNGGSASDAQHWAAEWAGRYRKDRPALPALALTSNSSDLTAIGNDYGFDAVFSRLIEAHGQQGDVAIAISTSGNSPNILRAVKTARERGMHTLGVAGKGGGELAQAAELAIVVPSLVTARIQESHITLAHILCELVEEALFPELQEA